MFAAIVRHEWKGLRADAALWVAVGLVGVSMAYGLVNGLRWVHFQRTTIDLAHTEENERLAALETRAREIQRTGEKVSAFADPRNPTAVGQRLGNRFATLPPGPLAALAIGQSDLLPSYYKVSTDSRELVQAATEIENPHRLLAGRFDVAFVIVYLYPLLILALTYNMLSAEREQGILALMLSQPVALATVVAGKVGVRFALFVLLIIGLALVGLFVTDVDMGADTVAARLGLWAATVAAYGMFWFGLAIAVTSQGRGSAANAMTLAGSWLVLVVLLPSLFNLVATVLYPVPSRVELVQAVRAASDAATAEGSRLLGKYYEDHPELAADSTEQAMTDFNLIRVAAQTRVEEDVRPVLASFERQLARQQSLLDRVRVLSPALVTQEALSDIAGTGAARHRHFVGLVDAYHASWREYFVSRIFSRAQILDHTQIPRFAFIDEPFGGVVGRTLVSVAALLVPSLVIGWYGTARLRRYPITG